MNCLSLYTMPKIFIRETSSLNNRLCAMEGRTSAAETISQMFYLPVVFALYVLALGKRNLSFYMTVVKP